MSDPKDEPRDLTDDFKLSFRSTAEINEAFSALVARTAGDKAIRYRGKKPHRAALINAIVLYVADLPAEAQKAAIARGMRLLNAHLGEGVPPEEAPPEATTTVVKRDHPARERNPKRA